MPPKEGLSPQEQKRREIANQKHLTKTRLCNFQLGIQGQHGCSRGADCPYAHYLNDLRPPLEYLNAPWSKVYAEGNVDIQLWRSNTSLRNLNIVSGSRGSGSGKT